MSTPEQVVRCKGCGSWVYVSKRELYNQVERFCQHCEVSELWSKYVTKPN